MSIVSTCYVTRCGISRAQSSCNAPLQNGDVHSIAAKKKKGTSQVITGKHQAGRPLVLGDCTCRCVTSGASTCDQLAGTGSECISRSLTTRPLLIQPHRILLLTN